LFSSLIIPSVAPSSLILYLSVLLSFLSLVDPSISLVLRTIPLNMVVCVTQPTMSLLSRLFFLFGSPFNHVLSYSHLSFAFFHFCNDLLSFGKCLGFPFDYLHLVSCW